MDYLQVLYKRLLHLKRNFTQEELQKILTWIKSDRSLAYHRMLYKFFTYCWQHSGVKSFDTFMDMLKYDIGHCSKKILEINGEPIAFVKPKSLSFGKCSQRKFREVSEQIIQYAKEKWQIDFMLWEMEYKNNPELLT